jgi:hypothetical protein
VFYLIFCAALVCFPPPALRTPQRACCFRQEADGRCIGANFVAKKKNLASVILRAEALKQLGLRVYFLLHLLQQAREVV